ncbi:MAG: DUF262 domain-containing protein [Acholeplasmatales bacterium]|jgi:hypothetical protein|nr:DUF262 domain-containing protein [Acholeplasmatales bacterium]
MKYIIKELKIKDLIDDKKYLTNINMQRKYIYSHSQAEYLLDSIQKNIPIPAIYLWDNFNGTYDVLDGKQRITVIRLYNNPHYLENPQNFFIDHIELNDFLNYTFPIIICEGTEQEKIETFKRINSTSVPLKEFERMNALYQGIFVEEFGEWGVRVSVEEAKIFGSDKRGENCIKALSLFTDKIEDYFKYNKDISFINGLKIIIDDIVEKTTSIFKKYDKDMYIFAKIILENIDNVSLVNKWINDKMEILKLLSVHSNNGDIAIAPSVESFYKEILGCYKITGLDSRRFFDIVAKQQLYHALKDGKTLGMKICPKCEKEFEFRQFEIDHIIPWVKGGETKISNAQLLCKKCNISKGSN